MDAIKFIEADVRRGGGFRSFARAAACAAAALLPVALGIGMRDGLDGVFDPRVLGLNAAAALLLGVAVSLAFRRGFSSRIGFSCALLVVSLALSIERVFLPTGVSGARTVYGSPSLFWSETERCFLKGSFSSTAIGLLLGLVAFGAFSMPTRRWRIVLAAVAGVGGAVMLGFHCDSSSPGHLLLGHVASGAAIAVLLALGEEAVFYLKLRSALPSLLGRLKRTRRLS